MSDLPRKREFVSLCRRLAEMGQGTSTSGNCSCRTTEGIVMTATGVSLGETSEENLSLFDSTTESQIGGPKPTKDWRFHLSAYRNAEWVNTTIHVHPAFSIALGNRLFKRGETEVPSATPQFVMRCGTVPLVSYDHPGSEALAKSVERQVTGVAAILVNHGVITRGASLKGAVNALEELEENARILLLQGDDAMVLASEQVRELRDMKM